MIGFLCLLLTVGIYWVAKRMYRSLPKVYLSPLLITPLLVVGVLLATGTDYAAYSSGGNGSVFCCSPLQLHLPCLYILFSMC